MIVSADSGHVTIDPEQVIEEGRLHLVSKKVLFEHVFGLLGWVYHSHRRTEKLNGCVDMRQLGENLVSETQMLLKRLMQMYACKTRSDRWWIIRLFFRVKNISQVDRMC